MRVFIETFVSIVQASNQQLSLHLVSITVYGINSILYQRGIYPPETFEPAEHFGLFFLMSTDDKIKSFLETVLGQVQDWLVEKKVHQVTLVITNVNTKEVLEKWDFKVDYEGQPKNGTGESNGATSLSEVGTKDIVTIQKEIREVIRQITGDFTCKIKIHWLNCSIRLLEGEANKIL